MEDALVVGGMLIALLTHADRVKIGCIAQVVNAIAPIMTEPGGRVWKQTTYHPFIAASHLGRGTVLRSLMSAPAYDSTLREGVSVVKIASVVDDQGLTVFAVNRDPSGEPVQLTGTLRSFDPVRSARHESLWHTDLKAANTADRPDNVSPAPRPSPAVGDGTFAAELPPYSWNVLRFDYQPTGR
jgi:alpha-L-arabinofuranosidase